MNRQEFIDEKVIAIDPDLCKHLQDQGVPESEIPKIAVTLTENGICADGFKMLAHAVSAESTGRKERTAHKIEPVYPDPTVGKKTTDTAELQKWLDALLKCDLPAEKKKLIGQEYYRLQAKHPAMNAKRLMRKAAEKYHVKFNFKNANEKTDS